MSRFSLSIWIGTIFILFFLSAQSVFAHGYISSPPSRSFLCKEQKNKNCGDVQYEPQSIEALKNYPDAGPKDGNIAGGGKFPKLDEQSEKRWEKVPLKSGTNSFVWQYTAAHSSASWRYFITKKNWNSNSPLSRSSFDSKPFCEASGGKKPTSGETHTCDVPDDRSGYHVILGVWDVADTTNAFYQVIDVNLNGSGAAPKPQAQFFKKSTDEKAKKSTDEKITDVGYLRGEKIPKVPTKQTVSPSKTGDDSKNIQKEIDALEKTALSSDGFRGAIVLKKGTYTLKNPLKITNNGIVIRGSGNDKSGTVIEASGNIKHLIEIGTDKNPITLSKIEAKITDKSIKSDSASFEVDSAKQFKEGDSVSIAGYERVITKISNKKITIDIPFPKTVSSKLTMKKVEQDERIRKIGIENLYVKSNSKSADNFVIFNAVKNSWISNIKGSNFSTSLVDLGPYTKWVTVQNSELIGTNKTAFLVEGQLNLVEKVTATKSKKVYKQDKDALGPNSFIDSK